jgi:hypothetical protein
MAGRTPFWDELDIKPGVTLLPPPARYTDQMNTPSEVPMPRKKSTLADLIAQCDPSAPYAGEVWPEAQPVGREFGAPLKIDEVTIDRAARDNPDLPRSFVADTLQGLAEARAGKTTPFAPQGKRDDKSGLS